MRKIPLLLCAIAWATLCMPVAMPQTFDLPIQPETWQYGDEMIMRQDSEDSQLPVVFSHWSHRTQYTCRVCHFELGFVMKTNATEITEQANQNGEYCGACHNGEISFGHSEKNCEKCHSGGWKGARQRFNRLRHLPKAPFGNGIDWVQALELGLISPKQSILEEDYEPMEFKRELDIDADWGLISPALFSHDKHKAWLDCGDCHPAIFNVKKKSTEHFEMRYILEGKFCGACHLSVAFPLNDCKSCHPAMHR
jgi:c(7)-type cytochrome triheme protein